MEGIGGKISKDIIFKELRGEGWNWNVEWPKEKKKKDFAEMIISENFYQANFM